MLYNFQRLWLYNFFRHVQIWFVKALVNSFIFLYDTVKVCVCHLWNLARSCCRTLDWRLLEEINSGGFVYLILFNGHLIVYLRLYLI